MAILKTDCWVLHRRPYRQSSLILELLTTEGEHIAVAARAARSGGRRALVPPRLCSRLRLWYRKGRLGDDLYSMVSSEVQMQPQLAGEALLLALRANELIVRSTRRLDVHPPLPGLYIGLMRELASPPAADRPWRAVYVLFQLRTLAALGYGLDLERDESGEEISAERQYRLNAGSQLRQAAGGWTGQQLRSIVRGDLSRPQTLAAAEALARKNLEIAGIRISGS